MKYAPHNSLLTIDFCFRCLGTSHQGGYSHAAVVHALQKCGIRHIDTAKRYGCESLLQRAIRESGVKREDLWITAKLWHSDCGYENTKKGLLGVVWKTWCWISWYESFHIAHLLCLPWEYLQRWMSSENSYVVQMGHRNQILPLFTHLQVSCSLSSLGSSRVQLRAQSFFLLQMFCKGIFYCKIIWGTTMWVLYILLKTPKTYETRIQ